MNIDERMHKLKNGTETAVWAHDKIIEQAERIAELEKGGSSAETWFDSKDKLPQDEKPVAVLNTFRYKHYKPNSQQFKQGLKGRWQEWNGYGWKNADCEVVKWAEMQGYSDYKTKKTGGEE